MVGVSIDGWSQTHNVDPSIPQIDADRRGTPGMTPPGGC
jgi:hypothetical protein